MRYSKQAILARFHKIPRVRFEDQRLASFGARLFFKHSSSTCGSKPDWPVSYRFLFVHRKVQHQIKGPLQLDLFEPRSFDQDYHVLVTNKTGSVRGVLRLHYGHGVLRKGFLPRLSNRPGTSGDIDLQRAGRFHRTQRRVEP